MILNHILMKIQKKLWKEEKLSNFMIEYKNGKRRKIKKLNLKKSKENRFNWKKIWMLLCLCHS